MGGLLKKRSLMLLFVNGFFGVFPWQVITFWFFRYLETERSYPSGRMFVFMVIVVLVLAAGYPLGGALGDLLFKRWRRGRLVVSTTGILLGTVFLAAAPAIAGLIAVRASLGTAILGICTGAWAVCLVFIVLAMVFVPRDIAALRGELQKRVGG